MFQELFISPIIFLESILSSFILPKATSINPAYGNAASGAILSGLAITGIIPEIKSFIGLVMTLVSMFVLFCIQTVTDVHNSKKTISIWSNCIGLSAYGLISGLSLSSTVGLEFVQYAASIMLSTLAISYSLGHRYIEYISDLKDKIPLLLHSLSTPLGLVLGRYSQLDSINSDLLLGISAGTFLIFGINNIFSSEKINDNAYLETQPKLNNKIFICLSVFAGLVISSILQSSIITNLVDSNISNSLNITDYNSTEMLANVTNYNSTETFVNITDYNSTELLGNLTDYNSTKLLLNSTI